jgi:hypothetical protein
MSDKTRANAMSDYGAKKNIDAGYDGDEKAAKIDYYKSMAEENRAKAGYFGVGGSQGSGRGASAKQEWDDVTAEFGENDVKALRETGKRSNGASLGSDYKMVDGQIMIDRKVNPDKPQTQAQINELSGKGLVGSQMEVKNMKELTDLKAMIEMSNDPDERKQLTEMYQRAIGVSGGTKMSPFPSAVR